MENPEEVLQSLDEFAKLKPKDIPRELEDYLSYVAKTGDPVYQWSIVKCLFREKLLNVITDFYETCPTIDLPPCPNVDPFNYETMKSNLLERIDSFVNAPFTVQRLCELLTTPRKEYSRVDKFMRAIEKNILVVSTREPGNIRRSDVMQPDFLMNGVIDGRGLDIGEAIETVSSDGVNLMHNDNPEVNINDSDSIRIDCAGTEEIDMEDHPDVESTADNVWEKERETTISVENECVKNYEGGGNTETENKLKPKSEPINADDVAAEKSKEVDTLETTTESFSESVESEQKEESADSTPCETSVSDTSESQNASEVYTENKAVTSPDNAAVEEKPPETEKEQGDTVADTNTASDNDKPPEKDINVKLSEEILLEDKDTVASRLSANTVDEIIPEGSTSSLDSNSLCKVTATETDSIVSQNDVDNVAVESIPESGRTTDITEEISPLESLEEVTSNISPLPVSKEESVESLNNSEISKVNTVDLEAKKDLDVVKTDTSEEECGSTSEVEKIPEEGNIVMEMEQEERMEVDDVSQPSGNGAVPVDEPMDQSEQPAEVGSES